MKAKGFFSKLFPDELNFDVYVEAVADEKNDFLGIISSNLKPKMLDEKAKIILSNKRYYKCVFQHSKSFTTEEADEFFFIPEFDNSWIRAFKEINTTFIVSDCPNFNPLSTKTHKIHTRFTWWEKLLIRWRFKMYLLFNKNFLMWFINLLVAIMAIIATIKLSIS